MTNIKVQLPVQDASKSVETITFQPTALTSAHTIEKAFADKNNSLHIVFALSTGGTITLLKGDNYPNAMLGDLALVLEEGTTDVIIEDISRFENRDGSLKIKTATAQGTICAIAKRAGLKPVIA